MQKHENVAGTDGGAVTVALPGRTLGQIIDSYQTDRASGYWQLRIDTRKGYADIQRRLKAKHGARVLSTIEPRDLKIWYMDWSESGKLSMANAFITQLRILFSHGLMDEELEALLNGVEDTPIEIMPNGSIRVL